MLADAADATYFWITHKESSLECDVVCGTMRDQERWYLYVKESYVYDKKKCVSSLVSPNICPLSSLVASVKTDVL